MEAKLTELVSRLKAAAEANLKSIVLYGSAVTAEFRAGHSDLNVLCIVDRVASEDLEHLHDPSEWWVRQGNPPPLLFTLDELHRSADVFAIELLDITHHHRLLYGTDYFTNFEVPLRLHRLQVERELRSDWLRLRQAILAAPLSYKAHLGIMSQSVSIFCALFRRGLLKSSNIFVARELFLESRQHQKTIVVATRGQKIAGFVETLILTFFRLLLSHGILKF